MSRIRALPVVAILMALTLAGCIAEDPVPDEATDDPCAAVDESAGSGAPARDAAGNVCAEANDLTGDGRDLRFDLRPEDSVPAPEWQIGDQFGQHIFDGPDDSTGFHIESMVVADSGGSYTVATSDAELAKRHVFWDLPFLGEVRKSDLALTGYGLEWDFLFQFPLEDGKSWTRSLTIPDRTFYFTETYETTFTVSYGEAIDNFDGKSYPGFEIVASTPQGVLFEYAYVPYVQWYDEFYWYDLGGPDPSAYRMKAISMGTSQNWTGTYYVDEAVQRFEHFNMFCPFLNEPFCQPTNAQGTFTLGSDAEYLFGVMVPIAWVGAVRVVLEQPEGQPRVFEHQNTDPPSNDPDSIDIDAVTNPVWIDEGVTPGDYAVTAGGAGAMWGVYTQLVEIDEVAGTL